MSIKTYGQGLLNKITVDLIGCPKHRSWTVFLSMSDYTICKGKVNV